MKLCYLKGIICLCIFCFHAGMTGAQVTDRRSQVDTLSIAERLSIRTNAVDWTLLMPNIGVEFDIRNTNWNRWAVGLSVRGNWQTSHTFKPGLVYNMMGVRAEFRNYWRPRQIGDRGVERHTKFIDKVFSCRRTRVRHHDIIFYRGLYASYNDFSIKLIGDGYQGSAVTAGFTYGVVKPLYVFKNGNSLDLELGISAGLSYAKYDRYRHDRESDCYPVTERKGWGFVKHPVVSDLRVGFVYRLGKYPSTKKYRWRYDCDKVYQDTIDARRLAYENKVADKKTLDSIMTEVRKDFWHDYDSIAKINKAATDSLDRIEAAKTADAAKLRKAEKERERKAKSEAKAAAKAAKNAAKNAAKDSTSTTPTTPTPPTKDPTPPTEDPTPPTKEPTPPTEDPTEAPTPQAEPTNNQEKEAENEE